MPAPEVSKDSGPRSSGAALSWLRSPAVPYIAPFVIFVGLLSFIPTLTSSLGLPEWLVQAAMLVIPAAVLVAVLRASGGHSDISFTVRHGILSAGLGIAIFMVWIGPDVVFPHYRRHWIFTNSITGAGKPSISDALRESPLLLVLRTLRATVIVPIVEELFWRSWMMRWLIREDFLSVPLGTWAPRAFWIVAVLFASEHGSYWDVGLAAGILYNWWILRTRSLGDLILAHAITNLCLSVYVIAAHRWQYW